MIIHVYSIHCWLRNESVKEWVFGSNRGMRWASIASCILCMNRGLIHIVIEIWMYALGRSVEYGRMCVSAWVRVYTVQIKYIIILAEILSNLIHMSKIYCWKRTKKVNKWMANVYSHTITWSNIMFFVVFLIYTVIIRLQTMVKKSFRFQYPMVNEIYWQELFEVYLSSSQIRLMYFICVKFDHLDF